MQSASVDNKKLMSHSVEYYLLENHDGRNPPHMEVLQSEGQPPCHTQHVEDRRKIVALSQQLEDALRERDTAKASANQYQREIEHLRLHQQQSIARHKQHVSDVISQMKAEYEEKISQLKVSFNQSKSDWESQKSRLEESNSRLSDEIHQSKGMNALRRFEERVTSKQSSRESETEQKAPDRSQSNEIMALKLQVSTLQSKIDQLTSQAIALSEQKKPSPSTLPVSPKPPMRSVSTQTIAISTDYRRTSITQTPPVSKRESNPTDIRSLQSQLREKDQLITSLRARLDQQQTRQPAFGNALAPLRLLTFPPMSEGNRKS